MNFNSRRLRSLLLPLLFFVFDLFIFDFFWGFNGIYNRSNHGGHTRFGELLDGSARIPVFSHGIAYAPFKLHVMGVWIWNLCNLRKKKKARFKDGAYYCYCAYVLRISRYSDFLSPMLTNAGILLCSLKQSRESRPY